MRKYYIFSILLIIFCLSILTIGFLLVGSPISQQAVQLDANRLTAFNDIENAINTYVQSNSKLPERLTALNLQNTELNDPQTNQPYDYAIVSQNSYKLCTTFSTDSTKTGNSYNYPISPVSIYGSTQKHKKGYDCFTYTSYNYNNYAYSTPTPTPTLSPNDFPFLTSCQLKNDDSSSKVKIMGIYETDTMVIFTTNVFANAIVKEKRVQPGIPTPSNYGSNEQGVSQAYFYGQNIFKKDMYPDPSGVNKTQYTITVTDKSGNSDTSQQYTFQGTRTVLHDPRCNGKDIVPTPTS